MSVVCFGNGDEAFGRMEDRDGIVEQFTADAIAAIKCSASTTFNA